MSDTEPKTPGKGSTAGAATGAAWTDTERVRFQTQLYLLRSLLLLTILDGVPHRNRRTCSRRAH